MKEKKIARDTRNREKLAGDDWVMAEFYATPSERGYTLFSLS